MSDKHTKRELFETLLVFTTAAEAEGWVLDGIQHELDLLAKRAANKTADVKREAEQNAVKDNILAVLSSGVPMRANEIATALADGTTVQRVTALVRQMVIDGDVVREQDKKIVTFRVE